MKRTILIICALSLACFSLVTGNHSKLPSGPVAVSYFLKGDTLLPDYVCADTLIVVDERGLNRGMAMFEQGIEDATDYQLDSMFHVNCRIINQ